MKDESVKCISPVDAEATDRDHQLVNNLLEKWHVDKNVLCTMVRGQLARLLAQARAEERQRLVDGDQ